MNDLTYVTGNYGKFISVKGHFEEHKINIEDLERKHKLEMEAKEKEYEHEKEILELFFDKKKVLYQIETKGKAERVYSSTNDSRKYEVVILTNEASASASEVLAVCFKENYKKSTVIGTTTYGKGTVQKAVDLSSGSSIKFTTQKWLTPSGEWINEKGVKPNIEIKNSEDSEEDLQLKEAIKVLAE